ncbi:MAG TPA: hypothetical protein VFF69_04835 [Phycisphaerales bacterium]|nr:hypothetical protein [Phycisphaerales bacterium]
MVRDRLWPVLARRASAAVYRRSGRYGVARRHASHFIDADGRLLPEPRLEDQLAVGLADRLPDPLVVMLGVRGVRTVAACIALPARACGRLIGIRPKPPGETG